jgi:hypothetical protein
LVATQIIERAAVGIEGVTVAKLGNNHSALDRHINDAFESFPINIHIALE